MSIETKSNTLIFKHLLEHLKLRYRSEYQTLIKIQRTITPETMYLLKNKGSRILICANPCHTFHPCFISFNLKYQFWEILIDTICERIKWYLSDMKKLAIISNYFVGRAGKGWNPDFPSEVSNIIKELTNPERHELRTLLFNESKKLSVKDPKLDVLDWLQECFNQINRYAFRFHHVYFSPGFDILDNLRDLIYQSKKTLDLCIFSITDERLTNAIKNSHVHDVKIRILTDDNKTKDNGSKIKWLKENGIEIKIDHSRFHMHNKFGIIDSRIAFTGSFNWTKTASRANQENLLVTSNHSIVTQYREEFERLWEEMYKY